MKKFIERGWIIALLAAATAGYSIVLTGDQLATSGSQTVLSLPEVTATAAELNAIGGVTSTAAELNILDGVTSTAAELNILDGVTAAAAEINALDADATAGETGVTVAQTGAVIKQAVLTVSGVELIIDGSSGDGWGSAKLATLPEGRLFVLGVTVDGMAITADGVDLAEGEGGDFSLGTTATSDSTLDGTDVNLLASTSLDPIQTGVDAALADETAHLDGTSSAVAIYANFKIDDADVAASSTNTIAGVVTVSYINLGDY